MYKQSSYLLTVGNLTNVLIIILDLFTNLNSTGRYLIKLLKIWMIFIKDTPKLQVNQGSFL